MKNILNGSISEVNVEMQNNLKSVPGGGAWRQPLMSQHLPWQTQIELISVSVRNSPELALLAGSSSLQVFPCCQVLLVPQGGWEAEPWQGQVVPAQPGCSGLAEREQGDQKWFFVCSEAASKQTAPPAFGISYLLPMQPLASPVTCHSNDGVIQVLCPGTQSYQAEYWKDIEIIPKILWSAVILSACLSQVYVQSAPTEKMEIELCHTI